MKNDAGNYQKPTSYYDDYIRLITLLGGADINTRKKLFRNGMRKRSGRLEKH